MGKLASNILSTATKGKHADGSGLTLLIQDRDQKGQAKGSWVFRYTFRGQRYEMGLGSVQALSLANARNEVSRLRDLMTDKREPTNPMDEKRRLEGEEKNNRVALTLSEVAPLAFDAIKGTLKENGKAGRWYSSLELHILPKLGAMRIEDIHQRDIERALFPIWRTKSPTAVKAINRLSLVMRHGAALGLNVDLNAIPNAKQLLGNSGHVVTHHPALPWQDLPKLYKSLDVSNMVQRALALYILSGGGMRLRPLRLATVDQFEDGIWSIGGENLKGRKGRVATFRVPITAEMQRLVDQSKAENVGGLMFPSPYARMTKPTAISDQAIENIMRSREKEWEWPEAYRPHGLRASFRTWVADFNPSLFAVAETALAHNVGSVVERSYQRNDFLDQRRLLLENWANHVTGNGDFEIQNVSTFKVR